MAPVLYTCNYKGTLMHIETPFIMKNIKEFFCSANLFRTQNGLAISIAALGK